MKTPRFARSLTLAACLSLTAATAGCAAWWQEFTQNPGKFAEDFAVYVQTALQVAMQVWATIAPLLGTSAPDATAKFNAAVAGAQNAVAALLDSVHAAVTIQNPHPDFALLITDVQDAFARVMAIVAEFKTTTPTAVGAQIDALAAEARTIAAWHK